MAAISFRDSRLAYDLIATHAEEFVSAGVARAIRGEPLRSCTGHDGVRQRDQQKDSDWRSSKSERCAGRGSIGSSAATRGRRPSAGPRTSARDRGFAEWISRTYLLSGPVELHARDMSCRMGHRDVDYFTLSGFESCERRLRALSTADRERSAR